MRRFTLQGVLVYAAISGVTVLLCHQVLSSGGEKFFVWLAAMLIYGAGILLFYYWLDYQSCLLAKLNELVKAFTKGYFNQNVLISRKDEIGELNASLRIMADKLDRYITKAVEDRDLMETILASMVEGVLAFDLTGKLLRINRPGEEMLGVTREKAENRYFLEVIRNHQLADLLQKGLTEGKRHVIEELRLSPLDRTYYRVYITPIINHLGKTQGAIMVLRDITKVRQLEQMRTEFIANVSHELRTPLTSLKGYVETLLDGALENRETAERFLTIMNDETDRLTRLINDLFQLSQLETGRTEVAKRLLDSRSLADKAIAVLQPLAYSKNIRVESLVLPGAEEVYANPDMLEQVLINLLDNAIKYSQRGDTVKIEFAPASQGVCLKVEDTGLGIPSESLPRIFERFYRVDKARSRQVGGTGLGLAIVKHIVERHRGQIQVESEENQGTVFTVFLPGKPEKLTEN